jgi:hypothetical protein
MIKLLGIIINLTGWLIATLSLHMTKSTGGRMMGVIVGMAVCLVSLVFVLPGACNKNAIWKS